MPFNQIDNALKKPTPKKKNTSIFTSPITPRKSIFASKGIKSIETKNLFKHVAKNKSNPKTKSPENIEIIPHFKDFLPPTLLAVSQTL